MPASVKPSVALSTTNSCKHYARGAADERDERKRYVPCVDLHLFSGLSATCLEVLNTVMATGLDEDSQKKRANLSIKEEVSSNEGGMNSL